MFYYKYPNYLKQTNFALFFQNIFYLFTLSSTWCSYLIMGYIVVCLWMVGLWEKNRSEKGDRFVHLGQWILHVEVDVLWTALSWIRAILHHHVKIFWLVLFVCGIELLDFHLLEFDGFSHGANIHIYILFRWTNNSFQLLHIQTLKFFQSGTNFLW